MASTSIDSHKFGRLPIAMAEVAGPSPVPRLLANRCYQFRPNQAVPDEHVVKKITSNVTCFTNVGIGPS